MRKKRPKFTDAQLNYICEIIGDWYLVWKHSIANYDKKTHRLGFAKEQLKSLLCNTPIKMPVRDDS